MAINNDAATEGMKYGSWLNRLKEEDMNMNWKIKNHKLPTIWSTGNRNSQEDIDSISVETDNDSNRQASTIEAQRRKLKERTILAIIIGFVLIIAILVPLIVIIVLPKGGTSEKVFTVEMIVTVLNVEFEEALGSEDSSEYSNLKEQFCTEIEKLYLDSNLQDSYDGCVVTDLRNDSMKVFFTIVFVSSNPPSTSEVRTVLTRNTGDFVTSQETVLLGKYILDKDTIVVGPVTVIESESNPVPRIPYNDLCRVTSSCKTRQAECSKRLCLCSSSRYFDPQADHCFLCDNPAGKLVCDRHAKYRTADGTCNNIEHPTWGSSMSPQLRLTPPMYDDGTASPRQTGKEGEPLASPRLISNIIFSSADLPPRNDNLTMMVMQWGQFIDHEFVRTPTFKGEMGSTIECCNGDMSMRSECFPIDIPGDDPYFNNSCMNFVRSLPAGDQPCGQGYREQLNEVTSFIDGSAVYGSTSEEIMSLRTESRGLLKMTKNGFLPHTTQDICVLEFSRDHCQKAGDMRVNVVPSLGWSHTTFLREHNRIANILGHLNPDWLDETIFQETRRIIAAFLQHITYYEYLDAFLNDETMRKYQLSSKPDGFAAVYDQGVNPTIANVFAAAAFRHGHSQIANYQATMDKDYVNFTSKQPIETTYMNPHMIQTSQGAGLEGVARWLINDLNPLADRIFGDGVRNKLFERNHGQGFDLPALNIQRCRDHGIPSYNHWRNYCNLERASTFESLVDHDEKSKSLLKQVYRHVDDIDLYVGAMTETHIPSSFLGPTFTCLIGEQFKRLKTGDRFWYESLDEDKRFTNAQLSEIKMISLAKIICNNYDIETIQPNVFKVPNNRDNKRVSCDAIPDIDFGKWEQDN